jgi:hypothetical protein
VAGHARAPGSVPDLATDLVEGIGGLLDHLEAVDAERGVLGPLGDDVTDPLGAVGRDEGDIGAALTPEQDEEPVQNLLVTADPAQTRRPESWSTTTVK